MRQCSLKEIRQHAINYLIKRQEQGFLGDSDSCVGSCLYVSLDFTNYLEQQECEAENITAREFIGNREPLHLLWKQRRFIPSHHVTKAGDFVVDFTGSQFNPEWGPLRIIHMSEFLKDWYDVLTEDTKWKEYKKRYRRKDAKKYLNL